MALVLADRVRETSVTTGTGTLTLAGAVTGYQTFSSAIGNTNTCYYTIANPGTSEWEVGIGTVGAGTLARTTILSSSNAGSAVSFSAGAKDVFVTYPAEKAVYLDSSDAYIPASPVFNGNAVISDNSANAALRITQVGTGNALLVEDSPNPDSNPFAIDYQGYVVAGATARSSWWYTSGQVPLISAPVTGATGGYGSVGLNTGGGFLFGRSNGVDYATRGIVASGDNLGTIGFAGDDGVTAGMITAARISASVDGTPGATDMPGRLVFSTTADGASLPTERMRITSTGTVGIGVASGLTTSKVRIFSDITDLTATYNIVNADGTHTLTANNAISFNAVGGLANLDQNGFNATTTLTSGGSLKGLNGRAYVTGASGTVTSAVGSYSDVRNTGAGTLTNAVGFQAVISNTGGGTLTNAYGVYINPLTAGTNNYGVHSNIAAGTGRWNFYAPGSASNYFAGSVGIGTTALSSMNLRVSGDLTGSTSTQAIRADGVVQSDSTSAAIGVYTLVGTAAAAFTVSNLYQYRAEQGTFGAGSAVTNQYGYLAGTTLIGATNNYGFYGNIAAGTNRYNFYANGTAANYFAGALSLGASPSAVTGSIPVNLNYSLTGSTSVTNIRAIPTILSDVTANAIVFRTQPFTQAAAFTLGGLIHYDATQGTIGAGSAVVNQYGFNVSASLIGATNNYGFFSSIPAGTDRFNFYANGTAANVFAGTTSIGGAVGSESLRVTPVASAVNYLNAYGAATGGQVNMRAEGSDTNIGINMTTKGSGSYDFYTSTYGGLQFRIINTASAVNYLQATGSATGTATTLSAQGTDTNIDIALTPKGTGSVNVGGTTAIVANSSTPALRITQTGAGNALLVEDSANPDATPFVIDNAGIIGSGLTDPGSYTSAGAVFKSAIAFGPQIQLWNAVNDTSASYYLLKKDRAGAIVQSGDAIGNIEFVGFDGTSYLSTARIASSVDGTPGTNDMPGRLVFSTTADGASSPTERMRIDNAGRVGIGSSPAVGYNFTNGKNITGSTGSYATITNGTVLSDVTGGANIYTSAVSTQAAAFTLGNIRHFWALNPVIGAGSAVTSQYGFLSDNLTGATNNYGFYSGIASGTGRWNFYAAGTADNYFAGKVGVGTATPAQNLQVSSSVDAVALVTGGSAASGYLAVNGNARSSLTGATTLISYSTGVAELTNRSNQYFAFGTNSTEYARIGSTGIISLAGIPGAESLRVTPIASAVNYLQVVGNVTGSGPVFSSQGSDTNINIGYVTKGTGLHAFATGGGIQFQVTNTASAVNYLQVTGSVTSGVPSISAQGTDANISLGYSSKGVAAHYFYTRGLTSLGFSITDVASAVNYLQASGNSTGSAPTLTAVGSDTNIDITLTPKGDGYVVVDSAYSPNLTLTDAATIAWNTGTAGGQVATFTFVSSNRTMGAPTNLKNGGFYALAVIQNAGSNTLTWNAVFKWAGGTAPTLSTAAGAKDYFVFRSDGTNLYQQGISQAVA